MYRVLSELITGVDEVNVTLRYMDKIPDIIKTMHVEARARDFDIITDAQLFTDGRLVYAGKRGIYRRYGIRDAKWVVDVFAITYKDEKHTYRGIIITVFADKHIYTRVRAFLSRILK